MLFSNNQNKNLAKYFWQLSVVMVQSGALAGILLPKVPVMIVVLSIVIAFFMALLAMILDGFVTDDAP